MELGAIYGKKLAEMLNESDEVVDVGRENRALDRFGENAWEITI